MRLLFFRTHKNGLNFGNLAKIADKIADKIAKRKHFVSAENEPDSLINGDFEKVPVNLQ